MPADFEGATPGLPRLNPTDSSSAGVSVSADPTKKRTDAKLRAVICSVIDIYVNVKNVPDDVPR